MSVTVRVVLHNDGFDQLRRSSGVVDDLKQRAGRVQGAAGDGFAIEDNSGAKRSRITVITDSYAAKRRQARDAVLERAIDAAR